MNTELKTTKFCTRTLNVLFKNVLYTNCVIDTQENHKCPMSDFFIQKEHCPFWKPIEIKEWE